MYFWALLGGFWIKSWKKVGGYLDHHALTYCFNCKQAHLLKEANMLWYSFHKTKFDPGHWNGPLLKTLLNFNNARFETLLNQILMKWFFCFADQQQHEGRDTVTNEVRVPEKAQRRRGPVWTAGSLREHVPQLWHNCGPGSRHKAGLLLRANASTTVCHHQRAHATQHHTHHQHQRRRQSATTTGTMGSLIRVPPPSQIRLS